MRRSFTTAATGVLSLTLWAAAAGPGAAQVNIADVSGSGVHVHASVDHIGVSPAGDRTPTYLMTFSHATQVSGNYSVTVTGNPITSGSAIAGFLLGCGISAAGGATVGISPNEGLNASITPTITISPTPGVSIAPSVGGTLGLTQSLSATIEPGEVTTATTATATLDSKTRYPFQLTFNNAALNVAQCATPVSAVPFVTTSVNTEQGMVQTTAYGRQFTF